MTGQCILDNKFTDKHLAVHNNPHVHVCAIHQMYRVCDIAVLKGHF